MVPGMMEETEGLRASTTAIDAPCQKYRLTSSYGWQLMAQVGGEADDEQPTWRARCSEWCSIHVSQF